MNLIWYTHRLRKMAPSEVLKRTIEHARIYWTRFQHRHPERWPYERFAAGDVSFVCQGVKDFAVPERMDWKQYYIYNIPFDLTGPIDWHFSPGSGTRWPRSHYAAIDYRPGNRSGDVRINWELNRLQFLPAMARDNEDLARRILIDWMDKNSYLHGPAFIASMEVALRWISIYRAACLFKRPSEEFLLKRLAGLAIASGRFIQSRLSTHSSAGNHLIVEAVGLYWIGKALGTSRLGTYWIEKARNIINREVLKQINPDGSSAEQSFWYLGFVLDALFHYYLLEEHHFIHPEVWERVGRAVSFIDDLTLPEGGYPDFGDRDDGYVMRTMSDYTQPPFRRLIEVGAYFYKCERRLTINRLGMDCGHTDTHQAYLKNNDLPNGPYPHLDNTPTLKTYPNGGMTLMKQGGGRLLFRHALLGLESLYGHGHADALSLLFWWKDIPVLVDLGSGQYNGNQRVRDYFRSTVAHNTIEVGGKNQATITGPFMWKKSYNTKLEEVQRNPWLRVSANHDGYADIFSTLHQRTVEWRTPEQITITDRFLGPGGIAFRGAFHLGPNHGITQQGSTIQADFGTFNLVMDMPGFLQVNIFYGSEEPFLGWHSTVYGKWRPNHSIVFSGILKVHHSHTISIKIES